MVKPQSVDEVAVALAEHDYLADIGLATSIFLALTLERPLFLEGEAGVGKTEVAKVLSRWTGGELIRLQCHEGIDSSQAVYEWDYARQLLHLRTAEATGRATDASADQLEAELYDPRFLIRRPLLHALSPTDGPRPILLIDEVDRSDDEFEAFLLEALSDYTITIPEIGTIHADRPPIVILTSNRTRDVHDALKRRCLYHWVEHPSFEREVEIVKMRAPGVSDALARQVSAMTEAMRGYGLYKPPGIAETIDWSLSLAALGRMELDDDTVSATLGTVLKYREDQAKINERGIHEMVKAALFKGGSGVDPLPVAGS
ncbi:MAG: MoxR family ATPase [Acidimicrobiales bacterium]|nr:MoxR family ATPase [Acidimicrobiales bacterium]